MINYEAFNDQSRDCADSESVCAEIEGVALICLSSDVRIFLNQIPNTFIIQPTGACAST